MDVKEYKNMVRRKIWDLLEKKNVARFPRPVYGRIPNFEGADVAALRITRLKEWVNARVVKFNPDSPQKPLRRLALLSGKIIVMATPRLREGFLLLDPKRIPPGKIGYASSIRGAFIYGRRIRLSEIPHIDLVVTGCVAVDKRGARLGKGGGYAELEYAILRELGLVSDDTPVVTTIHDLQLVDYIPLEPHDLTIDVAATPTRLLFFKGVKQRPKGIIWELLGEKARLKVFEELKKIKGIG